MRHGITALGLALSLAMAGEAGAQELDVDPSVVRSEVPRFYLDLALLGANPVGDFGALVDAGFGVQAGLRFRLGERSPILLRLDGGGMIYGHERIDVCFPAPIGCRVGADLTTTNSVGYMGVGPEIAVPGPFGPYVYGTVGFSYFSTTSELEDYAGTESYFETRNYSDLVGAARVGGGIRFRVGGPGSMSVDVGLEYHRNGMAEYLRKGDILDHPDGSITVFPNRTEANFVSFRVGVALPLVNHGPEEGGNGGW